MSEPVTVRQSQAVFHDVVLPVGLRVKEVVLEAGPATLDRDPFRLDLNEPGHLRATVDEAALEAFLNERAPGGLKDFRVQARSGQLTVEATAKVVFEIRATAICTLKIVDETQLFVELLSVELLGVGAKNLVQQQLDQINPVLDTREFPLEIILTEAMIEAGEVVLKGRAKPL